MKKTNTGLYHGVRGASISVACGIARSSFWTPSHTSSLNASVIQLIVNVTLYVTTYSSKERSSHGVWRVVRLKPCNVILHIINICNNHTVLTSRSGGGCLIYHLVWGTLYRETYSPVSRTRFLKNRQKSRSEKRAIRLRTPKHYIQRVKRCEGRHSASQGTWGGVSNCEMVQIWAKFFWQTAPIC